MKPESYLVALDGSKESFKASEVAWRLAKLTNARLDSLIVVDAQSAWMSLSPGSGGGLIGSGPYIAAYEGLKSSLNSIADAIAMSFETRARGHNLEVTATVVEGNPTESIVEHTHGHSLLIISKTAAMKEQCCGSSPSVKIVDNAKCPVLSVTSDSVPWKRARLVVNSGTASSYVIASFLRLSNHLNLHSEIFWTDRETLGKLSISNIKQSEIALKSLFHDPLCGDEPWREAMDVPASTLLCVASEQQIKHRVMPNGPTLEGAVNINSGSSILVFPPCTGYVSATDTSSNAVA